MNFFKSLKFSSKTYSSTDKEAPLVVLKTTFCLFLHRNISCGYSLKPHQLSASNEYPQFIFLQKNMDNHPSIEPHDRVMRKPAFFICENKGADQLCGNPAADQCL